MIEIIAEEEEMIDLTNSDVESNFKFKTNNFLDIASEKSIEKNSTKNSE